MENVDYNNIVDEAMNKAMANMILEKDMVLSDSDKNKIKDEIRILILKKEGKNGKGCI